MRRFAILAAGALLALFWWQAVSVSDEHSTTADEIFHVTAGYAYGKLGDHRLHPENGYFPQRWATLPLLAQSNIHYPITSAASSDPAWRNADAAEIGFRFFYEQGNDLAKILRTSRAMIALLGVALGALVFAWSRSLFGTAGALVSVAIFAFEPNLLAHAGLATSDIAACMGFLLATVACWRLLHRITVGRVLAAGGALGLLALAKFSAVLFAPMLIAMLVVRALRKTALPIYLGSWRVRWRGPSAWVALVLAHGAAATLAIGVIWAAYGFRFGETLPYNQPWSLFYPADHAPSLPLRVVRVALDVHALPEPYLYGLAHTLHFADGRPAFFLGEYRSTGWPEFFPVAFLLKTPLSVFALMVLAAIGMRCSRLGYRLAPLAVLLGVYWVFAVTSHLNIGLRHVLITYPVLAIFCGAAARLFTRRWATAVTAVLLGTLSVESFAIRPHYLAYFTPLLGGPKNAYRYLVDSSLDWGQDLPGLARWLTANATSEKVYLSYFGSGHPAYYGIKATRLADGFFDLRARELLPEMRGGIYCISATMYQQSYTLNRHGWTPELEARYRALIATVLSAPANETSPRIELEHLRFGRLCAWLHAREPDVEIGYSILIFRLTDDDVRTFLNASFPFSPKS